MFLKQLDLCNFRNYETLKLDLNEHTNIICGNNNNGKNNNANFPFKTLITHINKLILIP